MNGCFFDCAIRLFLSSVVVTRNIEKLPNCLDCIGKKFNKKPDHETDHEIRSRRIFSINRGQDLTGFIRVSRFTREYYRKPVKSPRNFERIRVSLGKFVKPTQNTEKRHN